MIKSILNFFKNTSEKEVYILTSLSTFAGGVKSENDTHWTCSQTFVAYVDCETNQLYKTKGIISWQTEDNTKHPFNFEPKTIYKVKVKQTKKNDLLIFSFIEVIDSFNKNNQLLSLIDEFFIVDAIANFEFDRNDNTAEGEINWLGEEVFVYFYNVPNITSAKQTLMHLKEMVKNISSWDNKLKTYIAEQTLEKVNDWISNYSEHSKITMNTLKNDSIIDTIDIYPNGDFFISYILKTYHYMINVEGNVNGEFKKAYLEE